MNCTKDMPICKEGDDRILLRNFFAREYLPSTDPAFTSILKRELAANPLEAQVQLEIPDEWNFKDAKRFPDISCDVLNRKYMVVLHQPNDMDEQIRTSLKVISHVQRSAMLPKPLDSLYRKTAGWFYRIALIS